MWWVDGMDVSETEDARDVRIRFNATRAHQLPLDTPAAQCIPETLLMPTPAGVVRIDVASVTRDELATHDALGRPWTPLQREAQAAAAAATASAKAAAARAESEGFPSAADESGRLDGVRQRERRKSVQRLQGSILQASATLRRNSGTAASLPITPSHGGRRLTMPDLPWTRSPRLEGPSSAPPTSRRSPPAMVRKLDCSSVPAAAAASSSEWLRELPSNLLRSARGLSSEEGEGPFSGSFPQWRRRRSVPSLRAMASSGAQRVLETEHPSTAAAAAAAPDAAAAAAAPDAAPGAAPGAALSTTACTKDRV